MSQDNMTPDTDMSGMTIGELRQYASLLRVPLAKTDTMEEIRQKITKHVERKSVARLATPTTTVEPGWAKIIVNEDPMPGAANSPVYVNANGYQCTLPRGVPIIVPIKIVNVLNDAVVNRIKQTSSFVPGQPLQETRVRVLSYPFQVLEMNPGPDPRPGLEAAKRKTAGPKMKFMKKFGYWPKRGQLMRAIEAGHIVLDDDEELSKAEQEFLEKK